MNERAAWIPGEGIERFAGDFLFRLVAGELRNVKFQIGTSSPAHGDG
jgi:hypothetical protein